MTAVYVRTLSFTPLCSGTKGLVAATLLAASLSKKTLTKPSWTGSSHLLSNYPSKIGSYNRVRELSTAALVYRPAGGVSSPTALDARHYGAPSHY